MLHYFLQLFIKSTIHRSIAESPQTVTMTLTLEDLQTLKESGEWVRILHLPF